MKKKIISFVLGAMLLALSLPAEAQQAKKAARIGFLDASAASGSANLPLDAFRQEMRKLGWIEGKNITIEDRDSGGKPANLPELAAELVRLKVDLIVVPSTGPALAAKNATATIPIVMMNVGDPVAAGLVASLARPGGNVTGLSSFSPELAGKRLEVLKETVPNLTRVGVLRPAQGEGLGAELQMKEVKAAALAMKLTLQEIAAEPEGFPNAFQTALRERIDALITISNTRFLNARKQIVELAGKYRLAAIYPLKEYVNAGGLMSYGTDYRELYRRAATYVDKILKGTKPADLPVEQPIKFEFIINLKTAKQIGLTIPPNVLARANKVIR